MPPAPMSVRWPEVLAYMQDFDRRVMERFDKLERRVDSLEDRHTHDDGYNDAVWAYIGRGRVALITVAAAGGFMLGLYGVFA